MKTINKHSGADILLIEAVKKQLELSQDHQWKTELSRRCPPILWFGKQTHNHPIILTIGANPSRKEYMADTSKNALEKVHQTSDDSLLTYLEPPMNRFRLLTQKESISDILTNKELQKEIIQGYDSYFRQNPYKRWFGFPKENSYNVEGLLRGFGASYYQNTPEIIRTVHIDLFPFATLSNFHQIQEKVINDLFHTGWAQNFLISLVNFFQPIGLILFGKTNFKFFQKYIDNSLKSFKWNRYGSSKFCIGTAKKFNLNIIGLSTNLGNPKGFSAKTLNLYGTHIKKTYYQNGYNQIINSGL